MLLIGAYPSEIGFSFAREWAGSDMLWQSRPKAIGLLCPLAVIDAPTNGRRCCDFRI